MVLPTVRREEKEAVSPGPGASRSQKKPNSGAKINEGEVLVTLYILLTVVKVGGSTTVP
jgi:hypothetical protein